MSAAATDNDCRKVKCAAGDLSLEKFHEIVQEQHYKNFHTGKTGHVALAPTLEAAEKLIIAYFTERFPSVVRSVMRASSSGGVGSVFLHFVFKGELDEKAVAAKWNALWEDDGALDKVQKSNASKFKRLRKDSAYPLFIASEAPTDIGDVTFCTAACFFIVGR